MDKNERLNLWAEIARLIAAILAGLAGGAIPT